MLGDAVDQVLAQEDVATSEVLWLLQDNLGSVRETVKNDGTVNSRVDFDPFGNMISIIDPSNGGTATTLKTRLNFTGQEWDADLRLVWYSDGTGRGRWYDPATGTFINQDALGFAAGDANLYRYVGNGATYLVDPSGLVPKGKLPPPSGARDEFCRSILESIKNIDSDIKKRIDEFERNEHGLPKSAPGDDKFGRLSREGHKRLINQLKAQKAYYEALYEGYCKDCDPDDSSPKAPPLGGPVGVPVPVPAGRSFRWPKIPVWPLIRQLPGAMIRCVPNIIIIPPWMFDDRSEKVI